MPDLTLHAPASLEEASQVLGRYQGEARAVAGGTAVVLMLRQGLIRPPALVRLDLVQGLRAVSTGDDTIRIGALTTLRDVAASALIAQRLPVLAGACRLVANVRVRNAATIGGNLCEADYASDPPGVLLALDARVRTRRGGETRELPVADLITDFYENSLAPDELVSDVLIPMLPEGTHGVYLKFITRSNEDRPCLGATAVVRLDADGRVADARVAIGAVAGKPVRLRDVESTMRGQTPSRELFQEVGERYAAASIRRGRAWVGRVSQGHGRCFRPPRSDRRGEWRERSPQGMTATAGPLYDELLFPEYAADIAASHATGIYPSQKIEEFITAGYITADTPIRPEQIQPASIDLRLGSVAYRVRASFLPGGPAPL